MPFFLVLIIIFFILPYVLRWALTFYARHKMKQFENMVRDAAGMGASDRASSGGTPPRTRRSGKKIGRDVGEYVAFEELPPLDDAPVEKPRPDTRREQQIEDVTWEDL